MAAARTVSSVGAAVPRRVPSPWLMVLPLGITLALLPAFTTTALVIAVWGTAALLTRPRWCIYLLALTVPNQSLLDVRLQDVSVSITEGIVALLLLAWGLQLTAGRARPAAASPLLGVVAGLLVTFALTLLVAENLNLAAKELLKWMELAAVFLAGTSLLETPAHRRTLLAWLLAAGASQGVYGLIQSFARLGPDHFMIGGVIMRAYGTFEQPNPFGGYLGMTVPLAVAVAAFGLAPGRWRQVVLAIAGVTGFALLITLSRGAWVAQVVALLLVISVSSRRARRALAAGAVIGTVLLAVLWPALPPEMTDRVASVGTSAFDLGSVQTAVVTPENWAVFERLSQWYAGWQMFAANPLLGVGIGNYDAAYDDYRLPQWPVALGHAHNHYLTIAAEAGLLGFIAYVAFWIVAFRVCVQMIRSAPGHLEKATAIGILGSLAAFATHNLFDVLFVHGMGVTVGLLITLLYGLRQGLAEPKGPELPAAPTTVTTQTRPVPASTAPFVLPAPTLPTSSRPAS